MLGFLGVPVDAAYHVVSGFVVVLTPLFGGLAAAAAIVAFTMAVRLLLVPLSFRAMRGMDAQAAVAARARELRARHGGQPERLQRELAAMYRAEGAGLLGGCLPLLLQWPFLSVMYLLFRSPRIGGAANSLLRHALFGAPLGSHWLAAAGPLSAQGAVFAGLFALLALVGWLSARLARRSAAAGTTPAGTTPAGTTPAGTTPAGTALAGTTAAAAQPAGAAGALARLAPFVTAVVAAFLPLAAGLYLLTTTAWTLAERMLLGRSGRGGRHP
jgi:YidC/Oxa1 family membrane protein insertase